MKIKKIIKNKIRSLKTLCMYVVIFAKWSPKKSKKSQKSQKKNKLDRCIVSERLSENKIKKEN